MSTTMNKQEEGNPKVEAGQERDIIPVADESGSSIRRVKRLLSGLLYVRDRRKRQKQVNEFMKNQNVELKAISFLLLSPACSSRLKDSSPAAIAWNRNGNINSTSNIGIVHAVWSWVHTPVACLYIIIAVSQHDDDVYSVSIPHVVPYDDSR
ncbi:hypothetical protein FRACYDRAFT_250237 [Fragilariopsis cylindrus CCMP1102]|uniref:Uncharacterized protein n=1 Tax=Fragilariopsis cylindrus CCMP1102 TaxID=635003 RepID=A0A1E7EQE3_9STRA|nr:hypothetical protein FRACYDRAFT_250237 [Fragilariopsis cylindrus CCMP1102]|eukprot:OEU08017.1 hypothetical protein FRACYDRAFT_250237 [Fragilariopsis cylindrus CCMP1102]